MALLNGSLIKPFGFLVLLKVWDSKPRGLEPRGEGSLRSFGFLISLLLPFEKLGTNLWVPPLLFPFVLGSPLFLWKGTLLGEKRLKETKLSQGPLGGPKNPSYLFPFRHPRGLSLGMGLGKRVVPPWKLPGVSLDYFGGTLSLNLTGLPFFFFPPFPFKFGFWTSYSLGVR